MYGPEPPLGGCGSHSAVAADGGRASKAAKDPRREKAVFKRFMSGCDMHGREKLDSHSHQLIITTQHRILNKDNKLSGVLGDG